MYIYIVCICWTRGVTSLILVLFLAVFSCLYALVFFHTLWSMRCTRIIVAIVFKVVRLRARAFAFERSPHRCWYPRTGALMLISKTLMVRFWNQSCQALKTTVYFYSHLNRLFFVLLWIILLSGNWSKKTPIWALIFIALKARA